MLVAALLFYKQFHGDLENIGFEFNPLYLCVANRIKVGKKPTVIFHVYNIMYSHVNPKVNDKFKVWININYVKHGEMNAKRGKLHYYLGMTFGFTKTIKVEIKMDDYLKRLSMITQLE